ncbi:S8 family serine peptidase [Flagellimonas sp.]|jgi:subtilisin family serine protease|uniref:S8 family serine peptidase n=1 Tax=Flagellimonas sp. TaxID=2058762 RepID=UPI003BADA4A1
MKKTLLKSMVLLASTGLLLFSCSDESQTEIENLENSIAVPESEESVLFYQGSYVIDGSYIIVFDQKVTGDVGAKFGSDYKSAKGAVKQLATEILGTLQMKGDIIDHVYSKTLMGVSARMSPSDVAKLSGDDRIAYIEKDQMFTLAPPPGKGPGGGGGGGGSAAQETPWGIARVNGGTSYTGNNVAWIIDSGIESTHEDLNVDVSRGYNAFTNGPDSDLTVDNNGHGTHVAGTVAAIDNEIGVVGVAAGATVIPVKVLDRRGSGSYSGVIAGIDFVAANASNGDVANMSLGGGFSQAVNDAVINASSAVKFAIAAGNESSDANGSSPASANGNNIYTISAMSEGDIWASFSNYGNPPVDYCEPGVAIKSTWPGGYNTISGTSMASPHACGLLLLGNISNGGTVSGDPDGNADTIGVN